MFLQDKLYWWNETNGLNLIPYPATSFNRIVCDRIPYWVALVIAVPLYLSFSLPTVFV